jgi:hypothetical protein
VIKDDRAPATKGDVRVLKTVMDEQFGVVLHLLDQKLDREYFDAKLEEMDQRWYNTFTNQGVVLHQHDKQLKAVERRVGIAA